MAEGPFQQIVSPIAALLRRITTTEARVAQFDHIDGRATELVDSEAISRRSLLFKATGVGVAAMATAGILNPPREVLASGSGNFSTLTVDGAAVFTAGPITLPNASVGDEALSENVALLNEANVFTAGQVFSTGSYFPSSTSGFYIEREGDRGITSVLPPLTENNPATRLLLHHPGSSSVAPFNFILTPYEYGMGISMDGPATFQVQVAVVGINGSPFDAPGKLVVCNQLDVGGIWLTSHVGGAGWGGESHADVFTQQFTNPLPAGSMRLRVMNQPRAVADGVTNRANNVITSSSAKFVVTDLGRRIQGSGIPAGTWITAINSASSVNTSSTSTASASGVAITIGTEAVEVWTGDAGTATKELSFGALGPAAQSALVFGTQEDTNLYRTGVGALQTDGTLTVGGGAGTGIILRGQRLVKTNTVSGPLQIQDGSGNGIQLLNAAGTVPLVNLTNNGDMTIPRGVGFWGHAAVAAQPAAPVTLADVIAVIRDCGLSA